MPILGVLVNFLLMLGLAREPDLSLKFPNDALDAGTCSPYSVSRILFSTQYVTNMNADLFENLRLELRRGCLTVAVLAQLRTEHYGYALRKALADRGLAIDENTLYPLLRRLESQGLLASHWREEDKRNKRFYRLSPEGEVILGQLLDEWQELNTAVERIAAAEPAPGVPEPIMDGKG